MIGGGIIGLAVAVNLSRAGYAVTVVDDPGTSPPASWGNAGHLATEQVMPLALIANLRSMPRRLFLFGGPLDFRLSDIAAWAPWAGRYVKACGASAAGRSALSALLQEALPAWHRLAQTIGHPELIVESGHAMVWENAISAKRGKAAWLSADIGTARVAPMAAARLADLASRLGVKLFGGIAFDHTGQVSDPGAALDALKAAVIAHGGVLREGRVRVVTADGVMVDDACIAAERIVVAAGIGSAELIRSFGHTAPLIAERGYHIEGDAGDWDLPPVVFEDRSMIVTRFGRRLRAAGFVEFGRAVSPPDPRKWARLRQHVAALGIPMHEPIREWMGARPTLPDYLPAIGVSRRDARLVYAFGHQHLGLTLAAVTGELVVDLMLGRSPSIDIEPFDLGRFDA